MSDIPPCDMVQVGVIQELLAVHLVEDEGEDDQGDQGADDEPDPGHRDVQHRPPARHVGQGKVEGEAVDDRVDLHVDGQSVHQPSQNINFLETRIIINKLCHSIISASNLLIQMYCQQDQGNNN